jgi:hypothetical protein
MNDNEYKDQENFDDEIKKGLIASKDNPTEGNRFWGSFNFNESLSTQNYSDAFHLLLGALHKCQSLDSQAYNDIHKGTPFYWLGTVSFILHNFESASFFFDAAVSEDLRLGALPTNNLTPALLFITLQGEQPNQAAQELVRLAQAKTQRMLDIYNSLNGRVTTSDFTLEDLRQKFLIPSLLPNHIGWRTLTTTFISFILEWDYLNEFFDLRPLEGTDEPFYLLLYKGCVLFESLLKANPSHKVSPQGTLGPAMQALSTPLHIPPNITLGNNSFADILNEVPNADNSIQIAITFTGKVRNTVAHNLGWAASLDKIKYFQLYSMIASSCFHAIACLY